MVPSGIKIGKQQLNALAYADNIALIGKQKMFLFVSVVSGHTQKIMNTSLANNKESFQ
jgi:hypothetical protein